MELLSGVHADAFTRAVERGLQSCGVDLVRLGREQQPLGGAVSGGADSMALLVALCSLCRAYGVSLHVITVNHNMRDEAAACGDAAFVAARCAEFSAVGVPVSCTIKTIPPGRVAAVAAERQCGTEAAARSVRYEAFHAFATQARLAYLCLAHTADDQLETIVMRFLQGSGRSGMRSVRGIFVRPLLALSRADVESFLHRHALSWRYDETNADTQYLRNRIRTVLLPQLDGLVPGWRRAVLTGHERAADAVSAIRSAADCIALHEIRNGGACRAVSVVQDELMKLPRAVRIQVVYNACNLLCIGGRIPYWFVSAVADGTMGSAAGVTAWQDGGHLFFKKTEKGATDSGFFVIIEHAGNYRIPAGSLTVTVSGERATLTLATDGSVRVLYGMELPLCVRSRVLGDVVVGTGKKLRSAASICAAWKVPSEYRTALPVVQALKHPEQPVIALWGSVYGYDDWGIKDAFFDGARSEKD